jgi:hypothetical protein
VAAFLIERDLAPSSHRVYALTLNRLVEQLGPDLPVARITTRMLARFLARTFAHLAPASHNRVVATLGSLFAYTTRQGWTPASPATGLERRHLRSSRDTPSSKPRHPGRRAACLPRRRPPAARQDPLVVRQMLDQVLRQTRAGRPSDPHRLAQPASNKRVVDLLQLGDSISWEECGHVAAVGAFMRGRRGMRMLPKGKKTAAPQGNCPVGKGAWDAVVSGIL